MKNVILSFLLIVPLSAVFSQEIRKEYKATASYDMEVKNKVYDKESDKVYENLIIKARVYYDKGGDWVMIEQLETNKDKPLEISVIDFKNTSKIQLNDKSTKVAFVKEHKEMSIPSYLKDEYKLEMGESIEKDGMTITSAKYIVEQGNKANADIEMTEYIKAPNYLKWMPIIQDDLGKYFPLNIKYNSEGKMGMMSQKTVNAYDFKENISHKFSTAELVFPKKHMEEITEEENGGEDAMDDQR
jgi:lipopolysaccharide export LptBFGC system permease protein LptF